MACFHEMQITAIDRYSATEQPAEHSLMNSSNADNLAHLRYMGMIGKDVVGHMDKTFSVLKYGVTLCVIVNRQISVVSR